jgi:ATP-dependent RNA helicase DHX8/PRP22
MKEVDDMMSQFEGAAKKARLKPDASERERSPKRQRRDRSWSPPRRRSQSPPRGRGYGDRRDDRGGQNGYGSRPSVDERPVLFKIYNGRVSGMKDFGAFVSLEGVAGRVEGM